MEKHRGSCSIKNKGNFFLSPLYPKTFQFRGVTFKSVAHYMQAHKFSHCPTYCRTILETPKPMDAMRLGTMGKIKAHTETLNNIITHYTDSVKKDIDWDEKRDIHFIHANYCKFSQNPQLKDALIATFPYPIVEDSNDLYWGSGRKGTHGFVEGSNKAGIHLVYVRYLLMRPK